MSTLRRLRAAYRLRPAETVLGLAALQRSQFVVQTARPFAGFPAADLDRFAVPADLADRRNDSCRTRAESFEQRAVFSCREQLVDRDRTLFDFESEIAQHMDRRIARNPVQD